MEQKEITRTKECVICRNLYPLDGANFDRNCKTKDGYISRCKTCRSLNRKRKYIHILNEKIICTTCLEYKEKSNFDKNLSNRHRSFCDSRCKRCKELKYIENRIRRNGGNSLYEFLNVKVKSAKERSKKMKISPDFDTNYVFELWKRQDGKCAISGIKMTYVVLNGRTPTNVSIDRIDSSGEYTKDNIQLVCMAVNQMKNDLEMNEFMYFCRNIVKNNKKK